MLQKEAAPARRGFAVRSPAWMPRWSAEAALRALRTVIVVPGLFAFAAKVIGDPQVATFAAFGGFATLVMAGFGGTRRDKLAAHLGLAVAGSALIALGTVVGSSPVLAALITLPTVFVVMFAGVAGPAAASGVTAALVAYVLPAATPGTVEMIPSRLAGWWLASVAGTAAVLLLSPRPPGHRLRARAAACGDALADQLDAALRNELAPEHAEASVAAKHALLSEFTATPYRPTGLGTTDQALDNLVGLLEWCTAVVCESLGEYRDLSAVPAVERELLTATARTLRDMAAVLSDERVTPDLPALRECLEASVAHLRGMGVVETRYRDAVHLSFHARTLALAVQQATEDALIAMRRADPDLIVGHRRRWYGLPATEPATVEGRGPRGGAPRTAALAGAATVTWRHVSVRSAWFLSSVRGAVALAAAIAVADATGVQHGFWVVLGTLSVLRTSAASTGATALRALAGTVAGFLVGALLLLTIGTGPTALWVALPIAVAVASYAPGTAPFAVGQAAFTVTVSVLYNLVAPAGWRVGMLRLEDVAIGCAVSLVVGVLLWPRGASAVVGDALADAFRRGGDYLCQSVAWALGVRPSPPDAAPAVTAGLRLDDALRGFLAERGTKHMPKEDLWRLVGGTVRLRLTGESLAGLPSPDAEPDPATRALSAQTTRLTGWFDEVAGHLGPAAGRPFVPLRPPSPESLRLARSALDASDRNIACTLWVAQHLEHIVPYLDGLTGPADQVARLRRAPWWR
ncbi:FUSC family protein [Actinoallomurus soli]|uniref:FUSC family protein n=1 Tax=Actinoallomurus soli TaxID=2952535 RepID=UPI002093962B|nr:FUSC family protein [Actinoallomurus soli]MCO5972291.1 FUSC family protein [Actinoallomurus soli]